MNLRHAARLVPLLFTLTLAMAVPGAFAKSDSGEAKGTTFTISGRITDSGGQPTEFDGLVYALTPSGAVVNLAPVLANGEYSIGSLPAGDYAIVAIPGIDNDSLLLPELYENQPCTTFLACDFGQATLVTVGPNATGIDIQLDQFGGRIQGRVFDEAGNAIDDYAMLAIPGTDFDGGFGVLVEPDGSFTTLPLPPGDYFLVALRPQAETLNGLFYDGVPCDTECLILEEIPPGATPITVASGQTVTGIDFFFDVLVEERTLVVTPPLEDDDAFGSSIAVCGNNMFVGLPGALNSEEVASGVVYVFAREGTEFTFTGEILEPENGFAGQGFGTSLACDGDFVAVGSLVDALAKGGGVLGAATVFKQTGGGSYGALQTIISQNLSGFGASIDLDGEEMIVGAPLAVGGGAALVYRFDGEGSQRFQQEAMLSDDDGEDGDGFGASVGISGGRAVVGAPNQAGSGALTTGVAQLFDNLTGGAGWSQVGKFTNPDAEEGDAFGTSVAIDGETMAIGAPGADDDGQNAGSAYLFAYNGGNAQRTDTLSPGPSAGQDAFGAAVALRGSQVVVGAPGPQITSGAAYLYAIAGGDARRLGTIEGTGEAGDGFGRSVAIDGNTLAFGAPAFDGEGANRGAAATLTIGDTLFSSSFER